MGIERHIQETTHIINLYLMLVRVFLNNGSNYTCCFFESILQNKVVSKGNQERRRTSIVDYAGSQESDVSLLELHISDG